jgi:hypothetical protein
MRLHLAVTSGGTLQEQHGSFWLSVYMQEERYTDTVSKQRGGQFKYGEILSSSRQNKWGELFWRQHWSVSQWPFDRTDGVTWTADVVKVKGWQECVSWEGSNHRREMAEQGQPVSLLELHRTGAQQDSTAGNTKQGERVTKAVQGSLGDTLVIGTGRVVGVVTHLLLLDCENQQRGSSRGWGCLLQLCSTCDLSPLHRTWKPRQGRSHCNCLASAQLRQGDISIPVDPEGRATALCGLEDSIGPKRINSRLWYYSACPVRFKNCLRRASPLFFPFSSSWSVNEYFRYLTLSCSLEVYNVVGLSESQLGRNFISRMSPIHIWFR